MRQTSRWEVRKNELTHRMLRVLIRNISNQHKSQCFMQEILLPDILAKGAYTYSLPMHCRQVLGMVRRAANSVCPDDQVGRISLTILLKFNHHLIQSSLWTKAATLCVRDQPHSSLSQESSRSEGLEITCLYGWCDFNRPFQLRDEKFPWTLMSPAPFRCCLHPPL